MTGYTPETLTRAKRLRHELTEAERKLWSVLRSGRLNGHKFRRQQPIGPYIADFACLAERLVVEADGSQHAESAHDAARDVWLGEQGFRVMRFWNNDILTNPEGVATAVLAALGDLSPPAPFPKGERGKGV